MALSGKNRSAIYRLDNAAAATMAAMLAVVEEWANATPPRAFLQAAADAVADTGANAAEAVAQVGLLGTAVLDTVGPGERFTAKFEIGLQRADPIRFDVRLHGDPDP